MLIQFVVEDIERFEYLYPAHICACGHREQFHGMDWLLRTGYHCPRCGRPEWCRR